MIVMFGSPKGGVGKTTALLLLANAILIRHPNVRVAVFETDNSSASLRRFFERRDTLSTADKRFDDDRQFRLYDASKQSDEEILRLFAEVQEWADVTLIDTAGAASQLNVNLAFGADAVIVPSRLGVVDLMPAVGFAGQLQHLADTNGMSVRLSILLTFLPPRQFLSRAERMLDGNIDAVGPPILPGRIRLRSLYKDAQGQGLMICEAVGQHSETALSGATEECLALLDDVVSLAGRPIAVRHAEVEHV